MNTMSNSSVIEAEEEMNAQTQGLFSDLSDYPAGQTDQQLQESFYLSKFPEQPQTERAQENQCEQGQTRNFKPEQYCPPLQQQGCQLLKRQTSAPTSLTTKGQKLFPQEPWRDKSQETPKLSFLRTDFKIGNGMNFVYEEDLSPDNSSILSHNSEEDSTNGQEHGQQPEVPYSFSIKETIDHQEFEESSKADGDEILPKDNDQVYRSTTASSHR